MNKCSQIPLHWQNSGGNIVYHLNSWVCKTSCWLVAEFPKKGYVFTVIRISNKVTEVLAVESKGHFWKEILPMLAWVG